MSIKQNEPPHRNPYAVRVFPYFTAPCNENPYFPLHTRFKIFSYGHHVTDGHSKVFNSLSSSVSIHQSCDLWHWRNISAIQRNIANRNINVVTTIWANTAAFITVISVQNVTNSFLISRASNQVTSQVFSSTYSTIRWSPLCCWRRFGSTAPACSVKKPANSYP
jgi:hypothetical protein